MIFVCYQKGNVPKGSWAGTALEFPLLLQSERLSIASTSIYTTRLCIPDTTHQCSVPKLDFSNSICQRIQELEATLYNALQQETVIKFGELLSEKQQEELRTAVEKLRRQMLRKSREYDCQILQERMELLQQAHQVGLSPCVYVRSHKTHACRTNHMVLLQVWRSSDFQRLK